MAWWLTPRARMWMSEIKIGYISSHGLKQPDVSIAEEHSTRDFSSTSIIVHRESLHSVALVNDEGSKLFCSQLSFCSQSSSVLLLSQLIIISTSLWVSSKKTEKVATPLHARSKRSASRHNSQWWLKQWYDIYFSALLVSRTSLLCLRFDLYPHCKCNISNLCVCVS